MALPYTTENQLKALYKEVQNLKRLFYLSNLTPTETAADTIKDLSTEKMSFS